MRTNGDRRTGPSYLGHITGEKSAARKSDRRSPGTPEITHAGNPFEGCRRGGGSVEDVRINAKWVQRGVDRGEAHSSTWIRCFHYLPVTDVDGDVTTAWFGKEVSWLDLVQGNAMATRDLRP